MDVLQKAMMKLKENKDPEIDPKDLPKLFCY